jgi:hypothetical protein
MKETETEYLCATPILVTTKGKVTFLESTIIPQEKNIIVIKKQKRTI